MPKNLSFIIATILLTICTAKNGIEKLNGVVAAEKVFKSESIKTSSASGQGIFGGSEGKTFNGIHSDGGWFHGLFHSPHQYIYTPSHYTTANTDSNQLKPQKKSDQNKDAGNYAVGFAISRSLSNDFFSVFHFMHHISKIPDKVRNKEFVPTTTTQGPVSTYSLNHVIDSSVKNYKLFKQDDLQYKN